MSRRRTDDDPTGLTLADLAQALATKLAPIYLLEGQEPFLAREALAAIRAQTAGGPAGSVTDAGEREFDGARADLAEILDELRTVPFFAPRRLVVVNEADKLIAALVGPQEAIPAKPARGAVRAETTPADALVRFLDGPPPPKATLVLIAARLDARFKVSKRIREAAVVVDCSPPDGAGLARFLRERAKARGRPFARDAEHALLERYGGGDAGATPLGALDAEVSKLVSAGEGPITVDEVLSLASELSSDTSFAIVEAIARGDARGALETLRSIFRDGLVIDGRRERNVGGFAPVILGLLGWDVGRLFRARALHVSGASSNDVVAAAKAFRDRAGFLARVRGATPDGLARRHAELRAADAKIKESADPLATLTLLLTRLALIERGERPALARR